MLYDAYLRYPRAFYDRHATGEVISRATNDIYPVRYFMGWGVVQAIQSMMMLVGAGIVLVLVNPMLALTAALAMPPVAILTYLFAHRVFPISREVQRRKGHLTEASDEAVVGIEMVQAFGREEDVRDRFHGRAEAVRRETMRQASVEARFLPGLIFLPTLGIAAVLLVGGREAIAGNLTIGEFTLFITLLLQLVWPLEALGWIINLGQRATAAASPKLRLARRDHVAPGARRSGSAPRRAADRAHGGRPLPLRRPAARCSRGIDLEAAPGEIVAVCGATGAGKTSLLNLLPRFYDPTAGRVLLGGVDVRDVALGELRTSVAIVTQKPVLFSIRLRDNLLGGRPDADWSEVLDACEVAGVAAFVDELPDGYDTLIGERGVNLSGGQRQRVALARALDRERARDGARRPDVRRRHRDRAPPGRPPSPRAERAHRADLRPAALDGARRRPRRRDRATGASSRTGRRRRSCARAARSRGCSGRRRSRHERGACDATASRGCCRTQPAGAAALGLVLLLAALSAAAPVAGWHVVGDAIDNGIRAGDETRLLRDVARVRRDRRVGLGARDGDLADAGRASGSRWCWTSGATCSST